MSANGADEEQDEEINRREVAWRVFAAEFDDANYSYAESDEERAPNYVVTPTGARVNRMFVAGVLTEVEGVSDDVVRARVVDPTGAFVVYAGQYQPDALAFLEDAPTPSFVAVTGKARTFQPEDSDVIYTSIRPESISQVDVDTRDAWVVQTAEQTLERVATFADAIDRVERGEDLTDALEDDGVPSGLASGIPLALEHYGTTATYLSAVRDLAVDAARVVAEEIDEVDPFTASPGEGDDETTVDVPDAFAAGSIGGSAGGEGHEREGGEHEAREGGEHEFGEREGHEREGGEHESGEADDRAVGGDGAEAAEAGPAAAEVGAGDAEGAVGDASDESESLTSESDDAADESGLAESAPEEETAGEPESVESAEETETDEMYELSEEERREVEENFDVGFSSGNEIPDAGEADIEPEADVAGEGGDVVDEERLAGEGGDVAGESDAGAGGPEPEQDATAGGTDADEGDADEGDLTEGELENAVLDVMTDLDEGDGVARDELVSAVVAEYGADESDVEDAIQSALMGGRCYESGDDRIKPI